MTNTDDRPPLTTEQAMLNQIRETPGDDTLRLVYADWLDETDPGERVPCKACRGSGYHLETVWNAHLTNCSFKQNECPACDGIGTVRDERRQRRAEVIRVQCELARFEDFVDNKPRADHWWKLKRRQRELLDAHGTEWARVACPGCKGNGWADGKVREYAEMDYRCEECAGTGDVMHGRNPQWSRGFVNQIECRMEEVGEVVWGYSAGTVFRPAPWIAAVFRQHPIERVRIKDREPYYNGAGYAWFDRDRHNPRPEVPETANIPTALFVSLTGHDTTKGNGIRWKNYPAAEAAHDALAHAATDVVRGG